MDFMKLLKSFEDFIFEAASWLVFYPLTLGRIMLHPLQTMEYSDREQAEDNDHRYDDALSPPHLADGDDLTVQSDFCRRPYCASA